MEFDHEQVVADNTALEEGYEEGLAFSDEPSDPLPMKEEAAPKIKRQKNLIVVKQQIAHTPKAPVLEEGYEEELAFSDEPSDPLPMKEEEAPKIKRQKGPTAPKESL